MHRRNLIFGAAAALAATAFAGPGTTAPQKGTVDFNRDVKPILSETCYTCHGPDAEVLRGNLRLDLEASAKKDRGGYRVIAKGDSAHSALIARINSADDPMPPASSGKVLTARQREILKQWVDQGAVYEPHWAFVAPKMPAIPKVKQAGWVRGPIDALVLAKLEAAGLKPEPEADGLTLLRRASLTLTGLPPSPSEIAAFSKDKSKDAYEHAVDRLLASPRYGENQARLWLDAVRYGDTHGLHLDNERSIYPYRDWVVRAYNQDLPFDKFTVWQMAGDMVPNPTTETKIASGYVRMNPTTNEGGAIAEEFQVRNTFDRVDTTSTVFLGLTMTCAKCHDHKYDPLTQKDYYQLFAFMNSTKDDPLDGNLLTPDPVMKAPTPVEAKELRDFRAKMNALEAKVNVTAATTWVATAHVPPPAFGAWEASETFKAENFTKAFETEFEPTKWVPVKIENGKAFPANGADNASQYFRTTIASPEARQYDFVFGSDDAIKIWLNGKLVHNNNVQRGVIDSTDPVKLDLVKGENKLIVKITNGGGPSAIQYTFGDARSQRIDAVQKLVSEGKGRQELQALYLEEGPDSAEAKAYRDLLKQSKALDASIPFTLVAEELPKPRPAFILRRGEYNLPTDPVSRALPEALGPWPADLPLNRLGLGEWIASPKNPIVPRVFVNRIWQQHFGTGIVKTAEDFGNQGEYPVNPQLLDYLAISFVQKGGSLKKLHKEILMSSAFRQASTVSPLKREKDPENRLISRGPRFRLDAEILRDQSLLAAGLLKEELGGKGFKPYQPKGIWEEIAFVESNTSRYAEDKDDSIYRRSLYLFWKRTSPHPIMLAFDAPMRETCVVRRPRTDTPLQALVTLNEPAFLEAARVMGERLVNSASTPEERIRLGCQLTLGRDPNAQEAKVLLAAVKRYEAIFKKDHARAHKLIKVGLAPHTAASAPETATYMMLSSTLMNLDEFLSQH